MKRKKEVNCDANFNRCSYQWSLEMVHTHQIAFIPSLIFIHGKAPLFGRRINWRIRTSNIRDINLETTEGHHGKFKCGIINQSWRTRTHFLRGNKSSHVSERTTRLQCPCVFIFIGEFKQNNTKTESHCSFSIYMCMCCVFSSSLFLCLFPTHKFLRFFLLSYQLKVPSFIFQPPFFLSLTFLEIATYPYQKIHCFFFFFFFSCGCATCRRSSASLVLNWDFLCGRGLNG